MRSASQAVWRSSPIDRARSFAADEHGLCRFDASKIGNLTIIPAIVNHKVSALPCLERAKLGSHLGGARSGKLVGVHSQLEATLTGRIENYTRCRHIKNTRLAEDVAILC